MKYTLEWDMPTGQANLPVKSTQSPSNIFQKLHQLFVEDARAM